VAELTDAQRLVKLVKAESILKNTEHGYTPDAARWRSAMKLIDEVEESLRRPAPSPVPQLGPPVAGEKSILLWVPTHNSDGFPGVWPAYDCAFGRTGAAVIAPEACKVTSHHGSAGGVGFKVTGRSKIVHLFLHCTSQPPVGKAFLRGEKMSSVARITRKQGGPHCHHAMDTRPLIGKWLLYGGQKKPSDRPRDYTFGSPTVGQQLAKELAS
jgi:hypothetical protein